MRHLAPMVLSALILAGCPQPEPATPGPGPDKVVIEAEMSHMGLQHPMSADPALSQKKVSYVVIGGGEVTVYADTPISCPAKVRLTGKWASASGDKGGQHVEERQFVAARWECIP